MKDKILKEAAKSPQVRESLKRLFPWAFEREKREGIKISGLYALSLRKELDSHAIFSSEECKAAGLPYGFIQIRGSGEYKGKAFYLDRDLEWKIKEDKEKLLCLTFENKY